MRIALAPALVGLLLGCGGEHDVLAGDAERGKRLLHEYGCAACHTIPGVRGAAGNTGPPLTGIARRVYLGGVLPNTPQNMAHWISGPQRFDPLTRMPDLGVAEADARDMVAHLYTLN
ncbi:MAG TPA: c-type cytochrome [Burkholderiales bacterium]|nr:c-type cytochrome [Burkholderiales bacterium]